jgi:molybdate transport system substrate-binding protein
MLVDPAIKRVALAQPNAVPAGIYAKEYLTKFGIWKQIERKVVATENVRAALAAVASGNADAGIVYKTDATISKNVKIAYAIPAQDAPKISYPGAVTLESKNPQAAARFLDYLHSPAASKVFQKFGFIVEK